MVRENVLIAIDPGTKKSAFAVFSLRGKLLRYQSVDMVKGFKAFLLIAMREHGTMVVENQHCRSRQAYKSLVLARGMIQGFFKLFRWKIIEVHPSTWRCGLFGGRNPKREEAQAKARQFVRRRLGLSIPDQDEVDAVCMGLYGCGVRAKGGQRERRKR